MLSPVSVVRIIFHCLNGPTHFALVSLEPVEGSSEKVRNIKIPKKKMKEMAMLY